jgi:hypothetical protein
VAAIHEAAGGEPVLVVSANPGCAMHLAAAGLDVAHPAELLADALHLDPAPAPTTPTPTPTNTQTQTPTNTISSQEDQPT